MNVFEKYFFCNEYLRSQGRECLSYVDINRLEVLFSELTKEISLSERCFVGAKVYRVRGLDIQEGQITEIIRGDTNHSGYFYPSENGTRHSYTASFPGTTVMYSQTYEQVFFLDLIDAQKKLAKMIEESIRDLEEEIESLREKMPDIRI